MTPTQVTVAVDFSDTSGLAIELAAELARKIGASLHLLHAEQLELPPYFTSAQIAALDRERSAARAQAHQYLKTFGQRHTTLPFTTSIDDRTPVDAILDRQDTELLVMGTHGRRGPSRWWMGSVAEQVVAGSRRPVLVVRRDGTARPFDHVLVETSGEGTQANPASAYAADLVRAFGSAVVESAGRPLAEAAAEVDASLVVVNSQGPADESRLRSCRRAILFVPPARS